MESNIAHSLSLEEIPFDPNKAILKLDKKRILKLPFTDRPTGNFLVVGEKLFAQDQTGFLNMYDLEGKEDGQFISRDSYLPLEPFSFEGIASDGDYVYLYLNDNFDTKLDWNYFLFAEQSEDEHHPYEVNSVSRKLDESENKHYYLGDSERTKMRRIVSFPHSALEKRSLIFERNFLFKEYDRILVPNGVEVRMESKKGFVEVNYEDDSRGDTKLITSAFLTDGKFYGVDDELPENLKEKIEIGKEKGKTIFDSLSIHSNLRGGLGAVLWVENRQKNENLNEDVSTFSLPLLPKEINHLPYAIGVQHAQKKLFLLHKEQFISSSRYGGRINIISPASLTEYGLSIGEYSSLDL